MSPRPVVAVVMTNLESFEAFVRFAPPWLPRPVLSWQAVQNVWNIFLPLAVSGSPGAKVMGVSRPPYASAIGRPAVTGNDSSVPLVENNQTLSPFFTPAANSVPPDNT